MEGILDLEPKRLWYYFNEMCKIPRESDHEAQLRDYLIAFSKKYGLTYKVDDIGNIVVRKLASPKHKSTKMVALQGHLDMVCVKEEGLDHDFQKDPIRPQIDGYWLKATGTTLGADNGIAIAAALAILENDDLPIGPIECLFTVSEETGLDGALGLKSDMLTGRIMINMDSEDANEALYIGCAGGIDTDVKFSVKKTPVPDGYEGLFIEVSGLRGGHTGLLIHEQRGNAVKIMARVLDSILKEHDVILSKLMGGTRHNAIPSLSRVNIAVKTSDIPKIEEMLSKIAQDCKLELETVDPELTFKWRTEPIKDVFEHSLSNRIIYFLNSAPSGVITMSYDIKDLVQTSTCIAVIKNEGDEMAFNFLTRGSVASEQVSIAERIASLGLLAGAKIDHYGKYPGWKPNLKSPLLDLAKKVYKNIYKKEAETKAVHAGLECGLIGEKYPGMDMISLSCDLEGAHSVSERVRIASVEKMWKLLLGILENIARRK